MQTLQASIVLCQACRCELEQAAKFCGFCGALTPATAPTIESVPHFAMVQETQAPEISQELKDEASRLIMQLFRERLLLFFHWSVFIGLNLMGLWLAIKCYNDFIGDEMSKIMIASTPFLYVNSVALLFIVVIKGTRREISRLKEKISYVRFKIEFGHLMQ